MTLAALLVAVLPLSLNAAPGDSFGTGHARLRLLSEETALVPGDTLHLGVSFEIEPGWHLYWKGQNDTGFPIAVDLRLPPGFTAGEILWPAPERHHSPGRILDHVYHDRVTLIVPVHVPPGASPDSAVTFGAAVDWLVCKDLCLPGRAETTLAFPPEVPDSGAAVRFREARARLPHPLPPGSGISFRWKGTTLRVDAAGARGLAFFPLQDGAKLSHLIEDGASASGRLSLRVVAPEPGDPTVISGVLEVLGPEGPAFYLVRETLPAH